jgi:hypothetical protein
MASIALNDLALSEALDRKAMRSVQGAACWVNEAFPFYVAPLAIPRSVGVFNFFEQNNITNNYIGQEVNQVTAVTINSGSNSNNTALLLGASTVNHG